MNFKKLSLAVGLLALISAPAFAAEDIMPPKTKADGTADGPFTLTGSMDLTSDYMFRGISQTDAQLLARISHGSLGRALRFAQDMETIASRNAQEAARKAKRDEPVDEDDEKTALMPGGVLAWVRLLAEKLDGFVLGQATASDVGTAINQGAAQFTKLQLIRDPLTSKDQATRQGIAFLLAVAADWFDDRLRQTLGTPREVSLPAQTAGLDPATARELIRAARQGEAQLDMNANVSLVLSATCTAWEELLRSPAGV